MTTVACLQHSYLELVDQERRQNGRPLCSRRLLGNVNNLVLNRRWLEHAPITINTFATTVKTYPGQRIAMRSGISTYQGRNTEPVIDAKGLVLPTDNEPCPYNGRTEDEKYYPSC